MADVAGNIPSAPENAAEAAVLAQVPAETSADETALEAKIAETASGIMGGNINDPRYLPKGTTNDPAPSGADEPPAGAEAGTAGEPAGAGDPPSEEAEAVAEAEPPVVQRPEPTPPVAVAPTPKDYSLTITGGATADAEGNVVPGKEYKIEKIEDLPEDFVPQNNRQILQIIQDLNRLESTKAADEAKAAVDAETTAAKAAETEMLTSWDTEIKQLQTDGLLDAPKLKPTDANYLTDPAMKKVADVFAFMATTNEERKAKGNPNLIRSFADAFDKMELADVKTKQAAAAKEEVEIAKLKAGVVGGGTASAGGAKAPVYVAGGAQDINDLL